jgi:hypothetical protein
MVRYLYLRTILSMTRTPAFKKQIGSGRRNDLTELMFNVVNDCDEP